MCNTKFYKTCIVLHSNVYPRFSLVQFLSHVWLFATPGTAISQASLSFTISQSLLKIMSTESIMPSNHLILCHPLLLPSNLPSIRVFFNKSALQIRWSRYWSFSVSISPSNIQGWFPLGLSGLISLWSKGLKSLHHSSKASVLSAWIYSWISSHFKVSPDWFQRWCLGRAGTGTTLRDRLGGRSIAILNFRDSSGL